MHSINRVDADLLVIIRWKIQWNQIEKWSFKIIQKWDRFSWTTSSFCCSTFWWFTNGKKTLAVRMNRWLSSGFSFSFLFVTMNIFVSNFLLRSKIMTKFLVRLFLEFDQYVAAALLYFSLVSNIHLFKFETTSIEIDFRTVDDHLVG